MHFASKVEPIKFRLGDEFGDYMLLEVDNALLEGDTLAAEQQATVDIINSMSVKEKNRASLLFDFALGKSAKMKLITITAKGEYMENPESLLLKAVKGRGAASAPIEAAPTAGAAPTVDIYCCYANQSSFWQLSKWKFFATTSRRFLFLHSYRPGPA